ncbi:hypothetical protein MJ1_0016 [Nanobdella aerobiophila]|uniref:Uncharacterized protein n=1 Tax=Nanobdella aerobiophila TaxID=2586965 RepID=A0A915SHS0_9ARCH|nr:hypothetical protein [Nanobdella aerobiophila]BBL45197.1 hypothetical protein MJ1_0016 [Nanobdella aerobiophila]
MNKKIILPVIIFIIFAILIYYLSHSKTLTVIPIFLLIFLLLDPRNNIINLNNN